MEPKIWTSQNKWLTYSDFMKINKCLAKRHWNLRIEWDFKCFSLSHIVRKSLFVHWLYSNYIHICCAVKLQEWLLCNSYTVIIFTGKSNIIIILICRCVCVYFQMARQSSFDWPLVGRITNWGYGLFPSMHQQVLLLSVSSQPAHCPVPVHIQPQIMLKLSESMIRH